LGSYVMELRDLDRTQLAAAGGKGAHLGELARIEGIRVPPGFCVTTDAFRALLAHEHEYEHEHEPAAAEPIEARLDRLSRLEPDDRDAIRALSAELRRTLELTAIPADVAAAIRRGIAGLGEQTACAVRSSATAEDLPAASFAGQQDTYLNVAGADAILRHVVRCWASLFSERAVTYRLRQGIDSRAVEMAVVVQRMVFPQAAGTVFTADPMTSNRKLARVEAGFGLGEGLVSGLVDPDVYGVRDGAIVARAIAAKQLAIEASPDGGTERRAIDPERRRRPALSDAQVVRLVALGRRIEAHFGHPQDIEWCLADGRFEILQSRPITTLFPIPVIGDGANHVYVSVGHQQMMTDPIKPLGLSVWQQTAARPMHEAAGRLFVDVVEDLSRPARRAAIVAGLGQSDPLIGDALRIILDRGDFVPELPDEPAGGVIGALLADRPDPPAVDPALVAELIATAEASLAVLEREIRTRSGADLLEFILADIQELKRVLFDPRSMQVIMAAIGASRWLNQHLHEWLGEQDAVDVLTQSVPNNVTSEMGLALLDVADAIRPHPELVAFLRRARGDGFLDELPAFAGGREARAAIVSFLDRYGVRCAGEIDITRPRWRERPATLLPVILGNVANFEPGAAERRLEQGRRRAASKERELLARLRALPDGEQKAGEAKLRIELVRALTGYREYPKYGIVSRYFVYKRALLGEAERLVRAGVLRDPEDIFHLRLEELHELTQTHVVDQQLIERRKQALRSYASLTPPRVMTSDGEVVTGAYHRDGLPAGALVALAVSAGTVEGRARVILDIAQADLQPGDILVTAFTDPSWTPLFVAIAGLVTEVGGLMTHGAVIAREYGLPAVVGLEHATELIRDRQRIRVHGSEGYVELLD
jgi:rifampicin phosphotransferase